MATYCDEPVDSYFYSPYSPYLGRYPRHKDAGWKYKSYVSHYGDTSEAFSNHQRAQLKSILSQINPKLTPRLRKANTKDVAVQVNPKRDASVQCSIGPRTLLVLKRELRRRRKPEPDAPGSPPKPEGAVRYPRSLAVYSPVAFRSVTSFLVEDGKDGSPAGEPPGGRPEPAKSRSTEEDQAGEDATAEVAEQRKQAPKAPQQSEDAQTATDTAGSKGKARVRFQFLEQKYGYYHCRECNLRWESAYVWCVQGTNKTCNKARCSCAETQRHVDPKRPHRQDLCGRCKGKRLSCDSTFSFKYIV
ncbi:unnamed protein product [Tetraodon nigroviridis]|uniref:(spotted green pufferfish) hypothetical protein n=1 Tax=Tetraodon nigroviridis TaxID=99883 RepID=Q4RKU5_TETNG|nr:unnamed protein product [Tetraodon nigroviridis]